MRPFCNLPPLPFLHYFFSQSRSRHANWRIMKTGGGEPRNKIKGISPRVSRMPQSVLICEINAQRNPMAFPTFKGEIARSRKKKNLKASSSQLGDLFKAFKWRCATIFSETTRTTYHCPSFVCIHQLVLRCCCCRVFFEMK